MQFSLPLIIIGISVLVILVEFFIGKFIGKRLSIEAGLIIGIIFIILLPLIFAGIPIIIYSNPKKDNIFKNNNLSSSKLITGSITVKNIPENYCIIGCDVSKNSHIKIEFINDKQEYYPTVIGSGIRLIDDPYDKITINGFDYIKNKEFNMYFENPDVKRKDFVFTGYGSVNLKYIIDNKVYGYQANHTQFSNGHAIIIFNQDWNYDNE
ncbi:MAG: hypothetical protein FWD13_04580 [Treponema sp.]|nr:hypothetical protein [Treponema sp.]